MSAETPQLPQGSAQDPNPQEQFNQDIEGARQALAEAEIGPRIQNLGPVGNINKIETLSADSEGPIVQFFSGDQHEKTTMIASNNKSVGENPKTAVSHDYRVEQTEGSPDSGVNVFRWNRATGETYKHTFKDPGTVHKFGALMARQVTARAEAAGQSQEHKAA